MVVVIVENATDALRGQLTRWFLELKPGVFVGSVSAMVREHLWKRIETGFPLGSALMVYSTNNEQGFEMKMLNEPYRSIVEMEGIQLIKRTQHA